MLELETLFMLVKILCNTSMAPNFLKNEQSPIQKYFWENLYILGLK